MRTLLLLFWLACKPVETPVPKSPPPDANASPAKTTWSFAPESKPLQLAAQPPMALTASDGTGLGIVAIEAKGVIDAPLAFTELHLTFANPRDQQIEGQFRIALPERASISRFAMKTGGLWQEGEVVEKQAARRAYEDFLHRRQDPALLEQQAGNEFAARIFPIPARGVKEVIISYSEELVDQPYKIALRGLPEVGKLDVHVGRHELHKEHTTPDADFVVDEGSTSGVALRRDNLVVARVTPMTEVEQDPTDSLFVLVDTSASRTLGKAGDLALVKALVAGLKSAPVAVWAFDQTTQLIDEGKAQDIRWDALEKRRSLGASNLHQALSAVTKNKFRRGLIITDGVVTAGTDGLIDALKATGAKRLDAIAVGGIRDQAALQRLTRGVLAHEGLVVDGNLPLDLIAKKLNHKVQSGIAVSIPGADWVWPESLDGLQPGEQSLVFADLAADKPFAMTLGGKPVAAGTMKTAARPLLERAWVGARIKKLLSQRDGTTDKDMKQALAEQVVKLSTTHRVLSPLTALLVLETENDYRRFNIDRKALADILTVDNEEVKLINRRNTALVAAKPTPVRDIATKQSTSDLKRKSTASHMEKDEGVPADRVPPSTGGAPKGGPDGFGSIGSAVGGGGQGNRPGRANVADKADADDRNLAAPAMKEEAKVAAAQEPSPQASRRARSEVAADEEAPKSQQPMADMAAPSAPRGEPSMPPPPPPARTQPPVEDKINPYTGPFAKVMAAVQRKNAKEALSLADAWWEKSPGDVMALVALGEALEANQAVEEAARAYGSLIDLFPARADMRRFAGLRLERLSSNEALALAADTYKKALDERPDHPQSHRAFAYTLLKQGQPEKAFDVIEKAMAVRFPGGRFAGIEQILPEDLGLAAAAWIKAEPSRKDEILRRLERDGGRRESEPSLRFVLAWETDANDVDFHIYDGEGGHAYYSDRTLPSGGELYADVTTGYGPECFTIRGKARAYPYKLQAHYYSRGPMGYGMGKLQIVQHDGKGGLKFEERPFVVMQDQAFLELGSVKRAL